VSREGAPSKQPEVVHEAGTPIWVGIVYFLGAVGAILLAFLLGLKLAAAWFWEGAPSYAISFPAFLWGALAVFALGLWVSRRRG
jgi:hypothetical protein